MAETKTRKKCQMCHNFVADDAVKCSTCGTKLTPSMVKTVETVIVSPPPVRASAAPKAKARPVAAPVMHEADLEAPLPPPRARASGATILTPAGPCPCKLESTSPEHVKDWRRRLLSHNPNLSDEAILYYANTLFPLSREHPKGNPHFAAISAILHEAVIAARR